MSFPDSSVAEESTSNAGDLGSIPGSGRSVGEGNRYPLQYSDLGNSMDCIVHGVANSRTQLNDFHFHLNGKARWCECVFGGEQTSCEVKDSICPCRAGNWGVEGRTDGESCQGFHHWSQLFLRPAVGKLMYPPFSLFQVGFLSLKSKSCWHI